MNSVQKTTKIKVVNNEKQAPKAISHSPSKINAKISRVASSLSSAVKTKISRLVGIKKWEHDLKEIDKAHDLLVDYYKNTEFNDIEFGAFGIIDLKKLQKTSHEKLHLKLSNKRFDKENIKSAFKILKIKSIDVKNKTHDEITKKIGISVRSLNMILKNKIEDHKAKQKLKLTRKNTKISTRKQRKVGSIMQYAFKN